MLDTDIVAQTEALLALACREEVESDASHAESDLGPVVDAGYRISVLLDRTAYCEVFRAVCSKTDRDVVVKLAYPSERLVSPERAELLINTEASALCELAGPSVVPMIETKNAGFGSYLVTRYSGACDLLTYCSDYAQDFADRVQLFIKLVRTLAAIHDAGWVHGDLKHSHVLVDQGHPVLIDFGLATNAFGALRRTRWIGGTPGYIAPEVRDGNANSAHPRQDVYSLGKLLERLLEFDTPTCPRAIKRVIARCTHTDAQRRYADAGEVLAELEQAPVSRPGRARVALASCALLLLTASPLVLLLTDDDRAQQQGVETSDLQGASYPYIAGLIQTNPSHARALLDDLPAGRDTVWEAAYLSAALDGEGVQFPFGPEPYAEGFPLRAAIDRGAQSLVWIEGDGRLYRADRRGRKLIATLPRQSFAFSLDFHPSRNEVLLCTATGSVFLLSDHGIAALEQASGSIKTWYDSDGLAIYAYNRTESRLTLIDLATKTVRWQVPTSRGIVLRANSHPDLVAIFRNEGALWSMTPVNPDGSLGAKRDVPGVSNNVLCYDEQPGSGRWAVGTYNGFVHYNNGRHWRKLRCSESMQVSNICFMTGEMRLAAATATDLEVFDLETGMTTLNLGGRMTHHRGIQQLEWSSTDRSLTGVSAMGVTKWVASHSR